MTEPGGKDRTARPGAAARALRPALAALVLTLAGCTAGGSFELLPAFHGHFGPPPPPTPPEKTPEPGPKPPPPRTLCQAFRAYLHCLHCPPPETPPDKENGKDKGDKEKEANNGKDGGPNNKKKNGNGAGRGDDKNPPATGDQEPAPGAGRGKENTGGTDRGESRNPPAAGEEKEENGEKEKEKEKEGNGEKEAKESWFSAHAQATMVTQAHDVFPSPYVGPHSLLPDEPSATSMTGTLFLDARLWESCGCTGELVFDPEIAGGRGFSGVFGIAGFPNGEITRVGTIEPTPYFARLFLRQTWALGDEREKVEEGPNQIAGSRPVERLTLVVGKMAATDLVDDNRYSHDPRTQFLSWSLMYNSAWDYPANVRGYTYGIGLDYNARTWALRYGIFAEPLFANGAPLDPRFLDANGQVVEFERRYTLNGHPGKLRLLAYLNHAHMGNYGEALALMPVDPDITLTRAYRFKYGCGLNLEQELTKDLGVWARLGWNDGHSESWAFTEVDRTAALGLLLAGRCWCRPGDQVGLAGVFNGLSSAHRAYLAAGGLGFILGDGRLNYGLEEILETFYNLELRKGIVVTAAFQEVNHPAYNRDRGPVAIGTLRVHLEY